MLSAPANADGVIPQMESTPAKHSKIPQRPISSRTSSGGRRSLQSVSASGSPSRIQALPISHCIVMSPNASSKIPKTPSTPCKAPILRSHKFKSGGHGMGAIRSSLPKALARVRSESPIVKLPLVLLEKEPSPLANYNKPLPSRPIAQVVDPDSPVKAQRTLVDAEAGSPSEEHWPILRPEHVSQARSKLTTNITVDQQQQQQPQPSQPIVFEKLTSRVTTNNHVNNRKIPPATAPYFRPHSVAIANHDENVSMKEAKAEELSEPRRFSSNNPYANAFHAVSPIADVALDSPLAGKRSRPTALHIPPRISSNRVSQPLFGRTQPAPPGRSASAQPEECRHTSTNWPLSIPQSEGTNYTHPIKSSSQQQVVASMKAETYVLNEHATGTSIEPAARQSGQLSSTSASQRPSPSPEQSIATTALEDLHEQICEGSENEQEISIFQALVQPSFIEHGLALSKSLTSNPSDVIAGEQPWLYNPSSMYWSKKLSWQEGQPLKGPILRIHRDADAVLLGNGYLLPEEPDESEQRPERVSLAPSLGSYAGRWSGQRISSTSSDIVSPTQRRSDDVTDLKSISPVLTSPIRPIRSMKPARQPSAEVSPRSSMPWATPRSFSERLSTRRFQPAVVESPTASPTRVLERVPPVEATNVDGLDVDGATSTEVYSDKANVNEEGADADEATVAEVSVDEVIVSEDPEDDEALKAVPSTPAKKARKILGLRKDTPPKNVKRRMTPTWLKPTFSSVRRKKDTEMHPPHGIGRMSSREFSESNPSTSAGKPLYGVRRMASQGGPSKLRASSRATPWSDGSSELNSISCGTQTPSAWARPPSSSPPLYNNATAPADGEVEKNSTLRLRAKQSFRNLLPKSDSKRIATSKVPQPVRRSTEPKRSIITTSGKTLVKRISRNFSKAHRPLKTPDVLKFELQNLEALTKHNAIFDNHEATSPVKAASPIATLASPTSLHAETAYIASSLVSGITKTTPLPNSKRRVDLADAAVNAVDLLYQMQISANQSQVNAEMMRKHARDAQLLAERVKLELVHVDALVDFEFEGEDIQSMVGKLKAVRVRLEEAADAAVGGGETDK